MTGCPILIATEVVEDAALVKRLLDDEFDDVFVSTDIEHAVEYFEKHPPRVLVLAFNTLEKAERYYLGLYRRGCLVHALPHRTIILCNKRDLPRVYELCKKEYFDDYALFWPMTHDAWRLPMAVHRALRQVSATQSENPDVAQFAAAARQLGTSEEELERSLEQGNQHIQAASRSISQAKIEIETAFDELSRRLADDTLGEFGEIGDRTAFQRELDRLKRDELQKHFGTIAAAIQTLPVWPQEIKIKLAQSLASIRTLQRLAERVRPLILAVDDDEFQHRLLENHLADSGMELLVAGSGVEALAILHRRRPDLALMDFALPETDGVEVVRRLKAVEAFSSIPIIMMTGHSGKEVVMESLQAGASDFVVKPFTKEVLLAKIRKLLS